jgi:hypothetical protein
MALYFRWPADALVAERTNVVAAAALSDKEPWKTKIAAAVGCSDWFGRHPEPWPFALTS